MFAMDCRKCALIDVFSGVSVLCTIVEHLLSRTAVCREVTESGQTRTLWIRQNINPVDCCLGVCLSVNVVTL